jgi:hypothetical protein
MNTGQARVSSPYAGVHPSRSPTRGLCRGVFPVRGGSPKDVGFQVKGIECLPRTRGFTVVRVQEERHMSVFPVRGVLRFLNIGDEVNVTLAQLPWRKPSNVSHGARAFPVQCAARCQCRHRKPWQTARMPLSARSWPWIRFSMVRLGRPSRLPPSTALPSPARTRS